MTLKSRIERLTVPDTDAAPRIVVFVSPDGSEAPGHAFRPGYSERLEAHESESVSEFKTRAEAYFNA